MKQQERQSSQQMNNNSNKTNKTMSSQDNNSKTKATQLLPDKINTINDSLMYIKKLIALTVSNITYLRMLFNDDCYADRSFENINVKILKDGSNSVAAKHLTNWLFGAYDAIEKKYLKSMVMAFFNDAENPDMVLETYEFGFRYADEEALMTLNINDKKSIVLKAKTNASRILRTIQVISSTLEPLPEETYITMKLYYYEDVTPIDYEPPYFQAAKNNEFNFVGQKVNFQVGHVNTLWHLMKLDIRVSNEMIKECDDFGDLPINKRNKSHLEDTKSSFFEMDTIHDVSLTAVNDQTKAYNMNELKKALDDKKLDQTSNEKPKETSVVVKCGCKMNDVIADGLIQCGLCKYWQHKVCFKMSDKNSSDLKHMCPNCMIIGENNSANDEINCLDQSIIGLNENELFQVCIIRRLLNDFIEKSKLTKLEMVNKYGSDNTNWLIHRLTKEGHIKCFNSKKLIYEIVNVEETLKSNYINSKSIKISDTPELTETPVDQTVPFTGQQAKNKENSIKKNQLDQNNNNENANSMEICKLTESTTKKNDKKQKRVSLDDIIATNAKKQKVSDSKYNIRKSN